jgi:GNAT superfamily N-acetyltransferase
VTTPAPPRVRRATPADAEVLVVLRAVMFEAMGTPADDLTDAAWREAAARWFAGRVDDPLVRLVVAEVDGEVVASAVGEVTALIPGPSTPDGAVGLVSNVATLPAHRGQGLATACTDAVLDWLLTETGVTRVDLFATPEGARIYGPRGFATSRFPAMRRRVDRG